MGDGYPIITVLMVEPGKIPYTKETENDAESIRKLLGDSFKEFCLEDDPEVMILRTDGEEDCKKTFNRAIVDSESGQISDVIAGNFLVVRAGCEGDYDSLTRDKINHYGRLFRRPEFFYWNSQNRLCRGYYSF